MVTIREGANVVQAVILADDVVRIRVGPKGVFANDSLPEYVVVKPDTEWQPEPFKVKSTARQETIATDLVTFYLPANPLTLNVFSHVGQPILTNFVFDFTSPTPQARFDLGPDDHIYGFGDKRTAIDKHGQLLDMWNTDAFASKNNDSYKNIPFYMSSAGYGLYLHNWWRSHFDLGYTDPTKVDIRAEGGEADFYLFISPSLKHIIQRYTELTGRPSFLPRWVFGYQQGKASYEGNDGKVVGARCARIGCLVT